MYKSYKYRIYPNKEQRNLIVRHFGACRWVYNYGLQRKIETYQQTGKGISKFEISKELPSLKKKEETKWLNEINSQSLQSSLENLDKAFTKFFKEKKGFPKFKSKKNNRKSFCIPQSFVIDFNSNKIKIPKCKTWIKTKIDRNIEGKIKQATILQTPTGKYFVSILVEIDKEFPESKPISENQAIGVDLGIKTFATLSDGIEIKNPRNLKNSLGRLKKLQRQFSRKKKGSNNRDKVRKKVAILHEKVSNQRHDFLHKTTYFLVKNYDTICLETLKPKNMMKNHCLAQALSDIAIGTFNQFIEYKAKWHGSNILRIGQFEPSSKMCGCGFVNSDLKLSDRMWTCKNCGTTNDRDLLAARNIKRFAFSKNKTTAGHAESYACGDMSSH